MKTTPKLNGYYLVGNSHDEFTTDLPIDLAPCDCCGMTYDFNRGIQRINATWLTKNRPDLQARLKGASTIYLMWVGKTSYQTIAAFRRANPIIRRKINVIPKDFQKGAWVALAHPHTVYQRDKNGNIILEEGKPVKGPGIFEVFQATCLEYHGTEMPTRENLRDVIFRVSINT